MEERRERGRKVKKGRGGKRMYVVVCFVCLCLCVCVCVSVIIHLFISFYFSPPFFQILPPLSNSYSLVVFACTQLCPLLTLPSMLLPSTLFPPLNGFQTQLSHSVHNARINSHCSIESITAVNAGMSSAPNAPVKDCRSNRCWSVFVMVVIEG